MGCGCVSPASVQPTSSKHRSSTTAKASLLFKVPDVITDYHLICSPRSPRVRIDICDGLKALPTITGEHCQYKLSYCFISQRGYYPHALGKANQDSYSICEKFCGDQNTHLFGIFDGHGENGDLCSHFAANLFPHRLASEIKTRGGLKALDNDESFVVEVHTRALIQSNDALHGSDIDDELSGTTAISVMVHKDHLFVANVGDSRAIIASDVLGDNKLRYSPLSHDQTPFRKDERDRIYRCGGCVMTSAQVEGNEPLHENWGAETGESIDEVGDPPRVWTVELDLPGCAFTRSIGDAMGETVGIFAEPEMLTWKVGPSDRYIIIASDGVFEFLTSQAVVDILSHHDNILEGANAVVTEAYRLWLTYDSRTDDITMIVLTIHDYVCVQEEGTSPLPGKPISKVFSPAHGAEQDKLSPKRSRSRSSFAEAEVPLILAGSSSSQGASTLPVFVESKPVRRTANKTKRTVISNEVDTYESEGWGVDSEEDLLCLEDTGNRLGHNKESNLASENIKQKLHVKSREEIARLTSMVQCNSMFQSLTVQQKDYVFQRMTYRTIQPQEIVIKEGDEGDEMYIVDYGVFAVLKRDESTHEYGMNREVFRYNTNGASFGELSLMYGEKRAATVRAVMEGGLWVVDRKAFQNTLLRRKPEGLIRALKTIPLLEDKSYLELQQLCYHAMDVTFENREVIALANDYLAGHYDWMFFIVKSGSIEVSDTELSETVLGGSGMNTPGGTYHPHGISSTTKQMGQLAARYAQFNSRVQSRAPSRVCTRANSMVIGPELESLPGQGLGPVTGLGLVDQNTKVDNHQQIQQQEQQPQQQPQHQHQQQQHNAVKIDVVQSPSHIHNNPSAISASNTQTNKPEITPGQGLASGPQLGMEVPTAPPPPPHTRPSHHSPAYLAARKERVSFMVKPGEMVIKTKKKAGVPTLVNLQYRGQGRYFAGVEFGTTPISVAHRTPMNHASAGGGGAGTGGVGGVNSPPNSPPNNRNKHHTNTITTTTTTNNNTDNAVIRALNRLQTSGNFPMASLMKGFPSPRQDSTKSRGQGLGPGPKIGIAKGSRGSSLRISLGSGSVPLSQRGSVGSLPGMSKGGSLRSKLSGRNGQSEIDAVSVHSKGGVSVLSKLSKGGSHSNRISGHSSLRSSIHALMSPVIGNTTVSKNHHQINKIHPSLRTKVVGNIHSTNASFFISRANSSYNLSGGISSPPQLERLVSIVAHGKTTISFFPSSAVKMLAGPASEIKLAATIQSSIHPTPSHPNHNPLHEKPRGNSITTSSNQSIFHNNIERQKLPLQEKIMTQRSEMTLHSPLFSMARCAYVGTFQHTINGQMYSIKIIAKHKAAETRTRMDIRLLEERNTLATLHGQCRCIPKVIATFQDTRVAMMIYDDVFCCDLAAAIVNKTISNSVKPFFAASIYLALSHLHSHGMMHRYLTPEAIYITTHGIPKLSDMRYCKLMDGTRSFTMCGDPYFLAPEIINRKGYDYSVDLWSYGVLLHEMCVGERLFGQKGDEGMGSMSQIDLFHAITTFVALPQSSSLPSSSSPSPSPLQSTPISTHQHPMDLKENDIHLPAHDKHPPPPSDALATPLSIKLLIAQLLVAIPEDRVGYKDTKGITQSSYFQENNLSWDGLVRFLDGQKPKKNVPMIGNPKEGEGGDTGGGGAVDGGSVCNGGGGASTGGGGVSSGDASSGGGHYVLPPEALMVVTKTKPSLTDVKTVFEGGEDALLPHDSMIFDQF